MKNAVLIYNPVAGGASSRRERRIREAAAELKSAGIEARLLPTHSPGAARELGQAAVREGLELILVSGGDGTINEVINGIAPGKVPLAILPGGTANVFSRDLGLPLDPVLAARQVARWQPRRVALGRATWTEDSPSADSARKRFFLSLAGVGFDAYIVHNLSRGFANSFGVIAYLAEGLKQVFRYRFPKFICRLEGREVRGTFAVIQRTERYAGWVRIAPGASVFRDEFVACVFKSPSRARYFLYAGAVLAGSHARLRDMELVPTRRVECACESGGPVYFELDGEPAGRLPATFEVVPDALTLLLPEGAGGKASAS